jgi:hypothetical protein
LGKIEKTSEELLKECDVLIEKCQIISDSLWAQLKPETNFKEKACEELLKECAILLEECHLINDAVEGFLGTKPSFRDEFLANMMFI